jgi:hypothetical protein
LTIQHIAQGGHARLELRRPTSPSTSPADQWPKEKQFGGSGPGEIWRGDIGGHVQTIFTIDNVTILFLHLDEQRTQIRCFFDTNSQVTSRWGVSVFVEYFDGFAHSQGREEFTTEVQCGAQHFDSGYRDIENYFDIIASVTVTFSHDILDISPC